MAKPSHQPDPKYATQKTVGVSRLRTSDRVSYPDPTNSWGDVGCSAAVRRRLTRPGGTARGLWPCTGQRGAAAGGAGCSGARRVEEEDECLACGPGASAARGWREEKRRAAAADRAGPGGEEGKRRGEKERGGPAGLVLAHAEVSPFFFRKQTKVSNSNRSYSKTFGNLTSMI